MTVKGVVEFGGKKTEVARGEIWRLKLSLDELCILHIVDDVMFYSHCEEALAVGEVGKAGVCIDRNEKSVNPENGTRLSEKLEFRELIIPYFYTIDYISLIHLNNEDAELLGDLLYGSDN